MMLVLACSLSLSHFPHSLAHPPPPPPPPPFSHIVLSFHQVNGCNVFKPEAARVICEAFGATHVLDISAGWGDRLLGCMSCPSVVKYDGPQR